MIEALGPLRPGDRIGLVAVSGPPTPESIDRAVDLVREWGLEPVVYPSVTARHPHQSYLAGPDRVRADSFVQAWCDPEIAGVFCVRGGYGSVRVLDLLDVDAMRAATPKPVYGSSDVTALHEWLGSRLGVCSWFSPMLTNTAILDDEAARDGLHQAVFEDWHGRVYRRDGAQSLVGGRASGRLIGGNLSLLAQTLGARTNPPWDHSGAIVLLEDVGEDTYRFDGYLTSLLRAGWFDGIGGLVLGSWAQCVLAEIRALVDELLVPLGVPTVWEMGFGHGPAAPSIPLGVQVELDAGDIPSLTLIG